MPYARESVKSVVDVLTETADTLQKMIAVKSTPEKIACWNAIVTARDIAKDVFRNPERITEAQSELTEQSVRSFVK